MKKILIFLVIALLSTSAFANPKIGQRFYLKYLKEDFGYSGKELADQHIQAEWKKIFENDGKEFITTYSKKHPKAAEFLNSEKFKKIQEHIKDFVIEYASDSGKIPSCK